MLQLFDTHTHFDVEAFEPDRAALAQQAFLAGVKGLILIGLLAKRFPDLVATQRALEQLAQAPKSYLAPGLHPFYIEQHQRADVDALEQMLRQEDCVAIGEIGLDFFEKRHKVVEIKQQQAWYFSEQIALAQQFDKPILLHIRKAHGEVLQQLKQHKFKQGGIAHAFSGGVEEAKAFIRMGFKIGITGQITQPNAKRLHSVVQQIGAEHLVLETDCPDMTPLCCQQVVEFGQQRTRNTPANLIYVLQGLSDLLQQDQFQLAEQLWQNSLNALHLD